MVDFPLRCLLLTPHCLAKTNSRLLSLPRSGGSAIAGWFNKK